MCAVIVTPRFFVKLKFLHDVSVACGAHVMCTQYHYRISFSYVDVCIICVWLYIYNLLPTISTYYMNIPWYVWCVYGSNLKVQSSKKKNIYFSYSMSMCVLYIILRTVWLYYMKLHIYNITYYQLYQPII
jgi:hypothetical protein